MTATPGDDPPLSREEAVRLVMDAVREAVTSGAIPPGAHLDCAQIARQHGLKSRVVLTALHSFAESRTTRAI